MSVLWVIGSLNVDLVVGVERFPDPGETLRGMSFDIYLGGKGGNQAMALARLGGAPRVVARVGSDQFGTRYRDTLAAEGADVSRLRTIENESTGTALIEVDTTGQNRIVIVAGANGKMDAATILPDLKDIGSGDIVLMQLEIPLEAVWKISSEAHSRGASVILDPAPAAEIPAVVLPTLDWITPNEHEASIITGINTSEETGLIDATRNLLQSGVTYAVVKAGARGAYFASQSAPEPVVIPGFPVTAVDTTAAGDSFNGGLAWALSRGQSPAEAVRTANAVAAISVTDRGAQTAMPDADAVDRLLSQQKS